MIVVDTNVVSEITKPQPSPIVLQWFADNDPAELFLNDVTIMELVYGAEKYLLKTKSDRYHRSLDELVKAQFQNRIARWNPDVGASAGFIRARREMKGYLMTVQDAAIAAICLSHGATLATRNTKDFEGLDLSLVNPFEGA
ncbi:MAG: PilT protein domain protein [Rhizobium sp.]|nr:PilT protein domain protein [Rhizobium sp.]